MADFMDHAEDLLSAGKMKLFGKQIAKLFDLRSRMRLVYANSNLDLQNIESLLTALEMGITLGGIGDYSRSTLGTLLRAAELLIVQTLEQSIQFPILSDGFQNILQPTPDYAKFVQNIHGRFAQNVAFLTFNYDIGIDIALAKQYGKINYSLGNHEDNNLGIPLLKLHGSTNWAVDATSGQIEVFDVANYLSPQLGDVVPSGVSRVLSSDHFARKYGDRYRPVIVPPTWNKSERHRTVPFVWKAAARHLSEATHVFIIGYSLPPSDSFFHHMFALSTMQNDSIRRFVVSNPDSNVEQRFRNLIGPGLAARFTFRAMTFHDVGFSYLQS
jgi:hypothetical protein